MIKSGVLWCVFAGSTSCLMVGCAAGPDPLPGAGPAPSQFESGLENQLGLTFSPDGKTAYWVAWNGTWGGEPTSRFTIYWSRHTRGSWSDPAPAPFSQKYSDSDPFVSPDGKWVYFVSDRPVTSGEQKRDDDIWRYNLSNGMLEAVPVNSDAEEFSPVMTASGTLYFASDRDGGLGQGDLYSATAAGDGFNEPKILSRAINSIHGEWNLWVAENECEMIFEASARPTNVSAPGDLYYSFRTSDGWQEAIPIKVLNSENSDLMPRLHPGGRTLYYTVASSGGHAQVATVYPADRLLSGAWIETAVPKQGSPAPRCQ